jgi:hypothetical protein
MAIFRYSRYSVMLDAILDRLQTSNTDNLTTAKMAIGVDRMRDICSDCMLLHLRRANLPQLCDPAAYMGCGRDEKATNTFNSSAHKEMF